MSKKKKERRNPDMALKRLVEHNDCFCDVVNFFLDEEEKITPDQLETVKDLNFYRTEKGLKRTERDVVKVVKGIGEVRIIIGVENQCYEDEGLPLRLMCYDGLSYYRFYREMKEGSHTYPSAVLTIVFNFSRVPMNGKSIFGLMDPKMYSWVGKLGNDYRVHAIDVGFLTEEDRRRLGKGTIGHLVKQLKKKEAMLPANVAHMDDLADAFKELTGEDFLSKIEDEPSGGNGVLMDFPVAIENVRKLKKEILDQGIEQGLELGYGKKELEVIQNLLNNGQPMEMVAIALGKSVEEVKAIVDSLQSSLGK